VQRFERFRQAREMIWHPSDLHFGTGHIEISRYDEQSFTLGWQNFFGD